jgi:septal ring factor EnvC (AmiA/AmiB activator)
VPIVVKNRTNVIVIVGLVAIASIAFFFGAILIGGSSAVTPITISAMLIGTSSLSYICGSYAGICKQRHRINTIKKQTERIKAEAATKEAEIKKIEKQIAESKQRIATMEAEIKKNERQIAEIEQHNATIIAEIEELEKQKIEVKR